MQLGYTYTSRDLLRHSVSARRGMRLRIFDARRARSEHARGFGPDEDPSPRARFPGVAPRGDPFRRCVSRSTRRTSARRATSRRAGADARARRLDAPRARGRRRAAGRRAAPVGTAVPEDAERERSRSLKPPRPRRRYTQRRPCAASASRAPPSARHLAVRVLRHAGARAHQVPAPLAAHDALGGRRQDARCAAAFLAPPLSFYERRRAPPGAPRRRAPHPFALLSARLAADLAREESAASVLRGRGPLALAAAVAAFLMDCERLHRFSAADIWENAHAHLATVALQAALTKAVERSARAPARRDASRRKRRRRLLYVADPMAGGCTSRTTCLTSRTS